MPNFIELSKLLTLLLLPVVAGANESGRVVDLSGTYSYESPAINCENPASVPRKALHISFGLDVLDESISVLEGKTLTIRQLSPMQLELDGGYITPKPSNFQPTTTQVDLLKMKLGKKDLRYQWINGVLVGSRIIRDSGTGEYYVSGWSRRPKLEVAPTIDRTERITRSFGLTPSGDLEIHLSHSIELKKIFSKEPFETRNLDLHCVLKRK